MYTADSVQPFWNRLLMLDYTFYVSFFGRQLVAVPILGAALFYPSN